MNVYTAGGWQTLADLDFTAMTAYDFLTTGGTGGTGGDGPHTLPDGTLVHVDIQGTLLEAAIVPGVGLRVKRAAGGGGSEAYFVMGPHVSQWTTWEQTIPLRAIAAIDRTLTVLGASDGYFVIPAGEAPNLTPTNGFTRWYAGLQWDGAGFTYFGQGFYVGYGGAISGIVLADAASDVFDIELAPYVMIPRFGVYDGTIPASNTLNRIGGCARGSIVTNEPTNNQCWGTTATDTWIGLYCGGNAVATAQTFVWKRLIIQTRDT